MRIDVANDTTPTHFRFFYCTQAHACSLGSFIYVASISWATFVSVLKAKRKDEHKVYFRRASSAESSIRLHHAFPFIPFLLDHTISQFVLAFYSGRE